MGKKVFGILYVILVAIFASCIAVSIAIAVVASIAALSDEGITHILQHRHNLFHVL